MDISAGSLLIRRWPIQDRLHLQNDRANDVQTLTELTAETLYDRFQPSVRNAPQRDNLQANEPGRVVVRVSDRAYPVPHWDPVPILRDHACTDCRDEQRFRSWALSRKPCPHTSQPGCRSSRPQRRGRELSG